MNCTFKTTRHGKRVVCGPAAILDAGVTVNVDGTDVVIDSVGKSFTDKQSGDVYCYGYGNFAAPATAAPTNEVAELRAALAAQSAQVAQMTALLAKLIEPEPLAAE
jgi:hypothetical protein